MTNRARRLISAAGVGLVVLLAASASHAQWTIAPFSINIKSKIYTFNYPTAGGGTFSCAACYVPGAVYSSSGTTGGAAYFYGPFFTSPRTVGNHPTPTSGYYFNPYWGAQHAGGVTNSSGNNPYTPLCVLDIAHLFNASTQLLGGPAFYVSPSQPGMVGVSGKGSFPYGGNYGGTYS